MQKKDYVSAETEYNRSVEVLGSYCQKPPLDEKTKRVFLERFLKSLSNTATCLALVEPPRHQSVIHLSSEALSLDPDDMFKLRAKSLRRRGLAHFSLRDWQKAEDDLKAAIDCGIADKALLQVRC